MNREKWLKIADEVADELNLPEAIRLPTPDDVAAALAEPWMVKWLQTFSEEFRALVEASGGVEPYSVRPDEQEGDQLGRSYGGVWLASDRLQALEALQMGIMALSTPTSPGMPADGGSLIIMGVKNGAFEIVHEIWTTVPKAKRKGLKDPLAALIKGFLLRPEEVRPIVDKNGRSHKNGIMPKGLFNGHPVAIPAQLRLDDPGDFLPILGRVDTDDRLPLFAELMDEGDIPVAPLLLADAAGFRGLQPGRGARLDKRLLIHSLLEVPRDQRRPGGRYELRKELREVRDLLFPNRERIVSGRKIKVSSYRPSKHAQPLHSALQAINLAEIVMPDGYHWRPVIVRGYPSFDDLDSEVIIQIELPSGSDHGPAVNKPILIEAGTISDPAFDLELGLAYLWDDAKARNGGYRIYATRPEVLRNTHGYIVDAAGNVIMERGRPATRWNHPKAVRTGRQERNPQADKVRVLSREERRRLAYGVAGQKKRPQLANERKMVERLLTDNERTGRIVIERDAIKVRTGKKGWRILESLPED